MIDAICAVCGEKLKQTDNPPGWAHRIPPKDQHFPALLPNRTSTVDLHTRIVDLLIENFLPQTSEFDPASNLLVRRGVSSVTDDIMRLVEDHFGVKS